MTSRLSLNCRKSAAPMGCRVPDPDWRGISGCHVRCAAQRKSTRDLSRAKYFYYRTPLMTASFIRADGVEQRAAVVQEREFAEPEDAVPRAAIQVGDVHQVVSGIGHEVDDFRDGILVVAADHRLGQKDAGLAEEIRGAGENAQVEAFGVDLHHVREGRAAGSGDFIQSLDFDGGLPGARGFSIAVLGQKGAAVVAGRNAHGHATGFVAGSAIDPVNLAAAVEEVLNMALQVILRFDERVLRVGKELDGLACPEPPVRANVHDVFGREAELLERSEKGIQAFAGPGTIVHANEAIAESAQGCLENTLHLPRKPHLSP